MSLRRVNLYDFPLDQEMDEAGFRHRGTGLGGEIGASRIGAGLYEAEAGVPIWPYHFHRGEEEWLLVLSGAPVLREPSGRRTLAPGDLVWFPEGPAGTHGLEGPGRFVIFSTGIRRGSVYPDSGKVSTPEGMLLLSPRAGYFYREGRADTEAELTEVGPLQIDEPARPVVNLEAANPGSLGAELGGQLAGATLYALASGESTAPYHYEWGREEWVVVLAGTPTLRHRDGEDVLVRGDITAFTEGRAGAHQLINRADTTSRVLVFSTLDLPSTVHYVDSDTWLLRHPGSGSHVRLSGTAAELSGD